MALVGQGYQVHWITSVDNMSVHTWETVWRLALAEDLPSTCRYLVPCQLYRVEGVSLLCVDSKMWQDTSLHTRLFSFLCLLQRELNWGVMHAWGSFVSVYVAVYTARFLQLPVVVSQPGAWLDRGHQQSFAWQWVNRHASAFIVSTEAERQSLLGAGDLTGHDICVINPDQVGAVAARAAVITNLLARSACRATLLPGADSTAGKAEYR